MTHDPNIQVDQWEVEHLKNSDVIDQFLGKTEIKEEKSLMHLGHMLSQKGDNMPNIINMRNKSIGTQKKILKLIEPMGPYRFEGAIIYIQSLLRNSILYAAETMCNVKESEFRALENIEESVLRKVFKTKSSCPWHLLYLEAGIIPARYQTHRQMLVFLQYILQQPKDSMMFKVFEAEQLSPTKGDWVSEVSKLLSKYHIEMTFKQVEEMKVSLFKSMVKRKVTDVAFRDLVERQKNKTKGKYIEYTSLRMADYLHPESKISTEEKIQMFSLRTEMNEIQNNFGFKQICELGCSNSLLDNEHILNCSRMNVKKYNFNEILNGSLKEKIKILKMYQENQDKRMKHLQDSV